MTITLTIEITKADLKRVAKWYGMALVYATPTLAEEFFTEELGQSLRELRDAHAFA
jgi:hypothetical protein